MRAVVVEEYGDYSLAHEGLVPKPIPKPGEVLVEMDSTVISNYDYRLMAGCQRDDFPLPMVPGIEGAGVVVQCGEGAEELLHKRVNILGFHTWAEYTIAPANEVAFINDDVSFDQGASMVGNPATVVMIKEHIRQGGHRAVTQNAANSSLGKMLIKLCKQEGIPLINIVRSDRNVEILRNMGAENVLNSSDSQFWSEYKALAERLGVSMVIDAVGGEMTGKLLACLSPGGVLYINGCQSGEPSRDISIVDLTFHQKRIEGLLLRRWLNRKSVSEQQAVFQEVQKSISTVFHSQIAGHFSMKDVQQALTLYAADKAAGKVILHPKMSS